MSTAGWPTAPPFGVPVPAEATPTEHGDLLRRWTRSNRLARRDGLTLRAGVLVAGLGPDAAVRVGQVSAVYRDGTVDVRWLGSRVVDLDETTLTIDHTTERIDGSELRALQPQQARLDLR